MSSARSGKGRHNDAEAGSRDERNLLVTVIANVARELDPALIVVENVPAFLSRRVLHPQDGWPVSAANFLLSELSDRYEAFPFVCDMAEFGIPQSRKRTFVTLVRKDVPGLNWLRARSELPVPATTHGSGKRSFVTLSEALAKMNLPPLDASTKERANHGTHNGLHSVPVWDEKIYSMVAAIPPGSGRSAWQNVTCLGCGTEANHDAVICTRCHARLMRPIVQEKDGTLRLVKGFASSYRRMYPDKPAATITTASGHIGSDFTIHPTENRLLSPLECAEIQTFPRSFKWLNTLATYGVSTLREMIGEAVPPAFTYLHGKVLWSVLRRNAAVARAPSHVKQYLKARVKLQAVAAADERPIKGLASL
jgi:DNA (cytosine-5)-methyltransferase 1